MSDNRRYILDANVLIEASRRYYGFDICPGFWTELSRLHEKKRVCSVDKVKTEVEAGKDKLCAWAESEAAESFFKKTADRDVAECFARLVNWLAGVPQYEVQARAEFASVADGWVIAYAKVNELVVVSHESYNPDAKRRVPIPNVCVEFDVPYCDTFEMLRELRVQFGARKRR